jgi:hypothetical protein
MIQKMLRVILAVNLVSFITLFVAFGSPLHHFRGEDVIADWWVFSTAGALLLFIMEVVGRLRRKAFKGFWIEATLLAAWGCAVAIMIVLGAVGFAGF